jgi:hypothetical protein
MRPTGLPPGFCVTHESSFFIAKLLSFAPGVDEKSLRH